MHIVRQQTSRSGGTGVEAKNSILIKGRGPLEASRHVKTIIFDETGTITRGKLSVAALCWAAEAAADAWPETGDVLSPTGSTLARVTADGATSRADALAVVAAAEVKSEHPLARAVTTYGKQTLL